MFSYYKEETQKLFESGQLSKEILCDKEQYELFMAERKSPQATEQEENLSPDPVISGVMDDMHQNNTPPLNVTGNPTNLDDNMPADDAHN